MIKKLSISLLLLFLACSQNNEKNIFQGRAEADEIRLSSQTPGVIDSMLVDEGSTIRKGQLMFVVDSRRSANQMRGQQAQIAEINANSAALKAQIRQLNSQLIFTSDLKKKTERMFSQGAATQQKLDEVSTNLDVLEARMDGLRTQFNILESKRHQAQAAMEITRININDAHVTAPINGVVLTRFHTAGETVAPGLPVLNVANLSRMNVDFYVPNDLLAQVKIGAVVKVAVDGVDKPLNGKIKWVASESEFTPKTILTRETRTTLVYRIKAVVDNPDGLLKIGMPVDVSLAE